MTIELKSSGGSGTSNLYSVLRDPNLSNSSLDDFSTSDEGQSAWSVLNF